MSTEEQVGLPIDQEVFQNSLTGPNAQDKLLSMVPCDNNELKQLTVDKMEIDVENEYDIKMSSVSVTKSKLFNSSSDIDVIIHNAHGIKSNKEKYGNQPAVHSQNTTDGCAEINLNTYQTEIYQRPLITRLKPSPLVVPFNNNQLSENCYNTVNIGRVHKKIKYDEIMSSDLDVKMSELFNSSYSAVSNSKKKMYLKEKIDNNLQNITLNVERKINNSPLRLLNQLVCGLHSKIMIASDNKKRDDTTYNGRNVCSYSDVLKIITSNTDETRKNEKKCVQKTSNLESSDYDIFDGIIDASEPRYCICHQVSFGKMIACDNKTCITKLCHYGCVDIIKPPLGKWYCPKCRNTVTKLKYRKRHV